MKRIIGGKPRNKLQKLCHDRFQRNRELAKEMESLSPTGLAKHYNLSVRAIDRIIEGSAPTRTIKDNPEQVAAMIRLKYERFQELKQEYEKHTCTAIAKDYGISPKTVWEYGIGNFGAGVRNKIPENVDDALLQPESIEKFLTMPTMVSQPAEGRYY